MAKLPLHFVGRATYNVELFVKEAMKYGVSRTMPLNVALNLSLGQPVLLAVKSKEEGVARVFGFFIVDGLTLPSHVARRATEGLDVKRDDTPVVVNRACGSYVVTARHYLDPADWEAVRERLKELAKVERFKVFVNGRFYKFEQEVLVKASFTRSIVYVDFPDFMCEEIERAALVEMEDYKKVDYRSEREKAALLHELEGGLTRWLE